MVMINAIRWRVFATYHICWWFVRGAKVESDEWPDGTTRIQITKTAWRWWRETYQTHSHMTLNEFRQKLTREATEAGDDEL